MWLINGFTYYAFSLVTPILYDLFVTCKVHQITAFMSAGTNNALKSILDKL